MTVELLLYMLVMINPFSQVLYVWELMKQMSRGEFAATYGRASLLSFGVCLSCCLAPWIAPIRDCTPSHQPATPGPDDHGT